MIYLDHNATTPPLPEVIEAVTACLRDDWGNPSSKHACDHLLGGWVQHSRSNSLDRLLDLIVHDPHRVFWP